MSVDELRAIVGAPHVLTDAEAIAPYLVDWRRRYTGRALAVVLPGTTDEVARVVAWCAQTRTPVVPQGGNTGLVGGAHAGRLRPRDRAVAQAHDPDPCGRSSEQHDDRRSRLHAARCATGGEAQHDRLFPLSLAAEGSATIGGNLSTNAGGIQVLRYGNARELCLGLEVVLPSGEIVGRPARPAQGQHRL